MKVHEATEQAYKNGYAKGYEDGKKDAVKHGRWNMDEEMYAWNCSVCRSISLNGRRYSYCHNCGADMRGEKE